ncbi:hypothetical protein D7B24_003024 [Verticillium nonalfalfae]|uniref:Aminoglycoside phosphotransferase domain-containing protein n=1 Tax=Verticillium nonalfalfae TaxID=1051616 RepID=A0A3M9YI31_9PEZI|nr:uncharacterized protein D7B24_003024 [Verticillium nonalfalfae]RNJ59268.1 hypothetical protein D7B24_003024 [Verticillium nonalfalfae]
MVKYGGDVTLTEVSTQRMVHEQLLGQVPIPEVFGWTEDKDQGFIYMSLIEGDTLEQRWIDLNETERQAICAELKPMVKAWRGLKQDGQEPYVGSIGTRPLRDIFLVYRPELVGPFRGDSAVQQFQDVCGIDIGCEIPIVFSHSDLVPPNVLLSRGPNPKVAAVIDWAQSGWYPSYWEYCKARRVELDPELFSKALQEEWREKYLPLFIEPVDDETYYHPWLWFVLSKGI